MYFMDNETEINHNSVIWTRQILTDIVWVRVCVRACVRVYGTVTVPGGLSICS